MWDPALFPLFCALTNGTDKRAALALQSAYASAAAIRTWLALLPVDQVAALIPPLRSIRGEKVPHARSSAGDGFVKHLLSHLVKPLDRGAREPVGLNIWMQPGPEQDFIGIDVPDSGDCLLMHEKRFQPAAATSDEPAKFLSGHGEGITAEPPGDIALQSCLIEQRKPPESTGIPIAQFRLPTARKAQPHMHMLRMPGLRGWEEQQSRHPQFDHDILRFPPVYKFQRNTFSESFNLLQYSPGIPGKRLHPLPNNVGAPDPYVSQTSADEGGA